jgi:hypothetical protein
VVDVVSEGVGFARVRGLQEVSGQGEAGEGDAKEERRGGVGRDGRRQDIGEVLLENVENSRVVGALFDGGAQKGVRRAGAGGGGEEEVELRVPARPQEKSQLLGAPSYALLRQKRASERAGGGA